MKPETV